MATQKEIDLKFTATIKSTASWKAAISAKEIITSPILNGMKWVWDFPVAGYSKTPTGTKYNRQDFNEGLIKFWESEPERFSRHWVELVPEVNQYDPNAIRLRFRLDGSQLDNYDMGWIPRGLNINILNYYRVSKSKLPDKSNPCKVLAVVRLTDRRFFVPVIGLPKPITPPKTRFSLVK